MTYPSELTSQLKAGDNVVAFTELNYGWIAVTEERVMYQARIIYTDTGKSEVSTNNFPIAKITNIGIKSVKVKGFCCLKKTYNILQINMQGMVYSLDLGKDSTKAQVIIREFNARN